KPCPLALACFDFELCSLIERYDLHFHAQNAIRPCQGGELLCSAFRAFAMRSRSSALPTASRSASSSDSAVFSLIRFSMYSGTVIFENGEIVRVERSARNHRPQWGQSPSGDSTSNFSSISLRTPLVSSSV